MSERKILTVGFELASADAQYASFESKLSLLDWDIVLFRPQINAFLTAYGDYYQGKPSLGDTSSFQLRECCEHWRREIKQAFETGKTVLVYLPSLQEVYVDTGQRSYSGTGRNQRITRHVALYNNYDAIPAAVSPVSTTGPSMKLAARATEVLTPYWSEFEARSKYEVLLTDPKVPACVVTRTGDRPVGAIYRSKASLGTLLLLPDIDFYASDFVKEKADKQIWTAAAGHFGARMVASVVALDKALRASADVTPTPAWALGSRFALAREAGLRVELLEAERRVEQAQKRKEEVADALRAAGAFRGLLFEKGKALEGVVIEALRLIGFQAARFRDSDSEFDVVFECAEGRFVGEVEGKDNRAVNIEKLRQLAMNIHEDLQRDDVKTPAKAVLFGNGFRLQSLDERQDPFTEKCRSAAATSSTALVFTPDLFRLVQYLLAQPDEEYSRKCREAILAAVGRVEFPEVPTAEVGSEDVRVQEAT